MQGSGEGDGSERAVRSKSDIVSLTEPVENEEDQHLKEELEEEGKEDERRGSTHLSHQSDLPGL